MKTIKKIMCIVLCTIFFPFVFVWALCKVAKDDESYSMTDEEHAINRAEYFKRNIQ